MIGLSLDFGSLLGSLLGGMSQAKAAKSMANAQYQSQLAANDANMQIADNLNWTNMMIQRETNDANLALANQQNQWNIDQWNRQNEYNSPANQVKLLRAAGINPALALNSNPFQPASSVSSAELANQAAPHLDAQAEMKPAVKPDGTAFHGFLQGAIQGLQGLQINAQTEQAKADAKRAKAEGEYYDNIMPLIGTSQALKNYADSKRVFSLLPYEQNQMDAQSSLFDSQRWRNKAEESLVSARRNLITSEIRKNDADADAQLIKNTFLDKKEAQSLRNLIVDEVLGRANAYDANSRAELNGVIKDLRNVELRYAPFKYKYEARNEIRKWKNAVIQGKYDKWVYDYTQKYGYDPTKSDFWSGMYNRAIQGKFDWSDLAVPGVQTGSKLIQELPAMFTKLKVAQMLHGSSPVRSYLRYQPHGFNYNGISYPNLLNP